MIHIWRPKDCVPSKVGKCRHTMPKREGWSEAHGRGATNNQYIERPRRETKQTRWSQDRWRPESGYRSSKPGRRVRREDQLTVLVGQILEDEGEPTEGTKERLRRDTLD
jgi:hypothetical protein